MFWFKLDLCILKKRKSENWRTSGYQLLKSHEEFRSIPVIYITANNDIIRLAQEAQADDYVAKPFNLDDLEEKVAQYLQE